MARLRGRGPPRPRLRPAARGRRARPAPGPPRRGPAEPGGGDRDRGPRAVEPVRPARSSQRRSARRAAAAAGAADPARAGPAARPAQPGATRRRLPRDRRGSSAARRPSCCRSTPWPARRCARRGAGRPSTIGRSLEAAAPGRWPATGGRSCSSTAAPRRSPRPSSAAPAPGYRLVSARLADGDDDVGGVVEFLPPGPARPPGAADPRQRRRCRTIPGGAGDPDLVPGPGLFSAPERFDQRPFSAAEAARTVTDTAVETLRARGEPARYERLLGEVLVGLDRAGQLRRLATREPAPESDIGAAADGDAAVADRPDRTTRRPTRPTARRGRGGSWTGGPGPAGRPSERVAGARRASRSRRRGIAAARKPAPDPVDRLLALVRDEMSRPDNGRLAEIEPGRWWLGDPTDREAAAIPLADRVEWAVFSLLSTAGPLSEAAFFERIATLFTGHDLPDEGLVRACLESYRSMASTPDRLLTTDDLLGAARSTPTLLADASPTRATGSGCGSGSPAASRARRIDGELLGDRLDEREQRAYLGADQPAVRGARPTSTASGTSAARSRCCSRSSGRRCSASRCCAATPGSRPTNRSSASSSSPRSGPSSCATSSDRSPLLRDGPRGRRLHIIKSTTCAGSSREERPDLADLEPLPGARPDDRAQRRADAALRRLTRAGALATATRRPCAAGATLCGHSGRQPRLTRACTRRTAPPWPSPDSRRARRRPRRPLLGGDARARADDRHRLRRPALRGPPRGPGPGRPRRAARADGADRRRGGRHPGRRPPDRGAHHARHAHGHREPSTSRRTTSTSSSCGSSTRWAAPSSCCPS